MHEGDDPMVRAVLTTPLYMSSVWILLITYQMFTNVAVISVIQSIDPFFPSIQEFLMPRIDRIAFVYSFAWIWVMTSLIPSLILKRRSALLQFVVVLMLTFLAFEFESILLLVAGRAFVEQIFSVTVLFGNPLLAVLYLLSPFLIIFSVDFYERRKKRLVKQPQKPTQTSVSEREDSEVAGENQ